MSPAIEIQDLCKHYGTGRYRNQVLHDISLSVRPGEFVAIVGPSGNGKSTLLNIICGVDRASAGSVNVNGTNLQSLNEDELSLWRGRSVGIVFQFFQLLPTLNLLQNVVLPMDLIGSLPIRERSERAWYLLDTVRLSDAAFMLPSQVSGGQQQRAAIARALANDPPIVVADEPTGNLDAATADDVFGLFCGLQAQGKTLIMVTHNPQLALATTRRIELLAGRIASDSSGQPLDLA